MCVSAMIAVWLKRSCCRCSRIPSATLLSIIQMTDRFAAVIDVGNRLEYLMKCVISVETRRRGITAGVASCRDWRDCWVWSMMRRKTSLGSKVMIASPWKCGKHYQITSGKVHPIGDFHDSSISHGGWSLPRGTECPSACRECRPKMHSVNRIRPYCQKLDYWKVTLKLQAQAQAQAPALHMHKHQH